MCHKHKFERIEETCATESHYQCECGMIKDSKEYWYEQFSKETPQNSLQQLKAEIAALVNEIHVAQSDNSDPNMVLYDVRERLRQLSAV